MASAAIYPSTPDMFHCGNFLPIPPQRLCDYVRSQHISLRQRQVHHIPPIKPFCFSTSHIPPIHLFCKSFLIYHIFIPDRIHIDKSDKRRQKKTAAVKPQRSSLFLLLSDRQIICPSQPLKLL